MLGTLFGVLALVMLCCAAASAADRIGSYRVLLLHSLRPASPINADFAAGVTEALASRPGTRVEIDSESLDLSRFDDDEYINKLMGIYRLKYREHPPDLIIPTYTPALRFLLEHGEELFPGVPIVFCAADIEFVAARALPSNVTGVAVKRDFAGTLDLMSQLDPDLRQVVVIVGVGNIDQQWEADARAALQPYAGRFEFTWLRGRSLPELTDAVKALPRHSAILYVLQFADRAGTSYVPRTLASAVAANASAPVYGAWDTLIGSGIVGGRLVTIKDDSVVAGKMALRILQGQAPAAIPVVNDMGGAIFDGRELSRWGIPETRLPPGSRILFRQPSVWDEHRGAIVAIVVVIGIQAMLIVALLLNRSRLRRSQVAFQREFDQRQHAEGVSRSLRTRLARFSRQSALGALATGIAHEISQPLAAIKNYAQAAKRYAARDGPDKSKLAQLLAEVEDEASRAGGIIQKIRRLVSTGAVQPVAVSLQSVVSDVLREIESGSSSGGSRIVSEIDARLPRILADPLQIQLVLVNLLVNALESVKSAGADVREPVLIDAAQTSDCEIEIRVADRGPGVRADAVEEIFDPLFSTKPTGMGVGLATCRSMVEAHGGRIWYTPNPLGGAIFRFTLPVATEA